MLDAKDIDWASIRCYMYTLCNTVMFFLKFIFNTLPSSGSARLTWTMPTALEG